MDTKALLEAIVEHPTKEEHGFEITRMNLLNLHVCSKLSPDEIEERVNRFSPSGTSNGWRLERDGNLAPVDCDNGDGSKHYVFSC
jgi:hypothetical protein